MYLPVLGTLSEPGGNWTESSGDGGNSTGDGSQQTTPCEPCLAFTGSLVENFPCWVAFPTPCK